MASGTSGTLSAPRRRLSGIWRRAARTNRTGRAISPKASWAARSPTVRPSQAGRHTPPITATARAKGTSRVARSGRTQRRVSSVRPGMMRTTAWAMATWQVRRLGRRRIVGWLSASISQRVDPPGERYFERRQVRKAIDWAESGGIAVHRNFDHYHGTRSARGFVMTRPFLHVIGLRPVLEEWATANGVPVQAIQPEKRRRVAHIDVFGDYALALLARVQPLVAATASFEGFARIGSKLYAQLSERILEDPELLEIAARAPVGQPPANLFFGAVHYLLLGGV